MRKSKNCEYGSLLQHELRNKFIYGLQPGNITVERLQEIALSNKQLL